PALLPDRFEVLKLSAADRHFSASLHFAESLAKIAPCLPLVLPTAFRPHDDACPGTRIGPKPRELRAPPFYRHFVHTKAPGGSSRGFARGAASALGGEGHRVGVDALAELLAGLG